MKFYEILDELDTNKAKKLLESKYNISEDIANTLLIESANVFKDEECKKETTSKINIVFEDSLELKNDYGISFIDNNNIIYSFEDIDPNELYNANIILSEIDDNIDNEVIYISILKEIMKYSEFSKIFELGQQGYSVLGTEDLKNFLKDFGISLENFSEEEDNSDESDDSDTWAWIKNEGSINITKKLNLFYKNKMILTDIFRKGTYKVYSFFEDETIFIDILHNTINIDDGKYQKAIEKYLVCMDTFTVNDDFYISNLNNLSDFESVDIQNKDNICVDIISNSIRIKRNNIFEKFQFKDKYDSIRIIKYRNSETNKLEGISMSFI